MRGTKCLFAIGAIVIGLTPALGEVTSAQGLPPGQLPTLTAEWWQWAASIPQPVNPLLDTTGGQCMVGQQGPIWFLAGSTGGGVVERACSVPEGATLLFPVINITTYNSPNVCGQGPENLTAAAQQALIKPFVDAAQIISVAVDGQDVKETLLRRIQAAPFEIALPADNIFIPPAADTRKINPQGYIHPRSLTDITYPCPRFPPCRRARRTQLNSRPSLEASLKT